MAVSAKTVASYKTLQLNEKRAKKLEDIIDEKLSDPEWCHLNQETIPPFLDRVCYKIPVPFEPMPEEMKILQEKYLNQGWKHLMKDIRYTDVSNNQYSHILILSRMMEE